MNKIPMTKFEATKALCDAAATGDVAVARKAIEAGAPINGRLEYGKTAVMFAIEHAQTDMVTLLKSKGARLNMLDEDREHPMIYAFHAGEKDRNGHPIMQDRTMAVIRTLLAFGADKDARGEFGTPAFHYAAARMDGKNLMELCELGLRIDAIDPFGGSSVLHVLARNKKLDSADTAALISVAIVAGVDIDLQNSDKETALMMARRKNNEVLAKALQNVGAQELTATASPARKAMKP